MSAEKDTELLTFNHRCFSRQIFGAAHDFLHFSGRFLMCVSHCGNVLVRENIAEKHTEV